MILCRAVSQGQFGKRMFWLHCGLERNHKSDHFDAKRNRSWQETFFWDEFEHGKPTPKGSPKRKGKSKKCRHCGKQDCNCLMERMADSRNGQMNFIKKEDYDARDAKEEEWFDEFVANYMAEHKRLQDEAFGGPYTGEW